MPDAPTLPRESTTAVSESHQPEGAPAYASVDEVLPPDHYGQPSERRSWTDGLRKFGTIGLVLFFIFGKLKYLGLLLQVGKFKTFISMLVSIWAYALFWGWSFAAGFVVLIFIHEMGHVLALRMMGIPATAPMFIPFVGAHIVKIGRASCRERVC